MRCMILRDIRITTLVLNGFLYLGVSFAQRDFLHVVLSRMFCPRNVDLGDGDDVVGLDEVRCSAVYTYAFVLNGFR